MSLIQREQYLDFLRRHKDQDVIKVVSGVLRAANLHYLNCLNKSY